MAILTDVFSLITLDVLFPANTWWVSSKVFLNKEKGATIIQTPVLYGIRSTSFIDVGAGYSIKNRACLRKRRYEKEGCDLRWRDVGAPLFKDFAYCDSGVIPWLLVGIPLGVQPFIIGINL